MSTNASLPSNTSLSSTTDSAPRSLSTEIDVLVEQIRSQAGMYVQLMIQLRDTAERIEQDRIKVEEAYRQLRAESKRSIADIEKSAHATMNSVTEHAQQIESLYGGLKSIQEFHQKTKNESIIAEEYRKRLEAMLVDTDAKVKKMYDEIVPVIEQKLGQQIYAMREQLRGQENKLGDIMEAQRRGFTRLEEEVDNFKSKIPETSLIVKQTNRRIAEIVEESYKTVEQQVAKINDDLEKAKAEVMKQSTLLGSDGHQSGLQKKIDVLETKTYKLEQQVKQFDAGSKRATMIAIGVGVAGIILSLSLIFAMK